MVRTLPAALTSAVQSAYASPAFAVTVQDLLQHYTVLASGGTSGMTSSLVSTGNAILVAVLTQGADPNTIYVKRITTPTLAAQWNAAGTIVTTNARAAAGLSITQTGSTTRLFYARSADNFICYRDSTDDGLTWGGENVVGAPYLANPYTSGIVAADINTVLVASGLSATAASVLTRSTYSAGWSAWSSEGPATPAGWGAIKGLSTANTSGYCRSVAGVNPKHGVRGIGDSYFQWIPPNSYTGFTEVVPMHNPGLGLSYAWPSITVVNGIGWFITAMLTDDGTLSGTAQTRTVVYKTTDLVTWYPFITFGNHFQYGAQTIYFAGTFYTFDGKTCCTTLPAPGATDISDDISAISIHEPASRESSCVIELQNAAGTYLNHPNIRADARILVSFGYNNTTVLTHVFYIDSLSYEVSATKNVAYLHCRDYLRGLDHPQPRMMVYKTQTIGAIAQDICKQAGVALAALPATGQFSQSVPCFIIKPGESWLQAIERLATIYGFEIMADQAPQLRILDLQAGDPSTWSYGSEILAVKWGQTADQANLIRVVGISTSGTTVFAEVLDSTAILNYGDVRYLQVVDRILDTAARCKLRATQELLEEQRNATGGHLVCVLNPAHERGDVITITEASAGMTNQTARIRSLTWDLNFSSGHYLQTLELSGV